MFDLGSSSNQLTTSQNNSIVNDLSFFFGNDNKEEGAEYGGITSSQEQKRSDDLGLSAVIPINGSSAGDAVTSKKRSEEDITTFSNSKQSGLLNKISDKTIYIGIAILGTIYLISQFVSFKFKKA